MRLYSVIIPVYNRPDEIDELLESLTRQTYSNFEVLVVEDGSRDTCEMVVETYKDKLDIHYFFKENSGQGFSRNFGYERARGDYFIVFDSDCLIPEDYFKVVEESLNTNYLDAFGGPDKADVSFTAVQKAINYSMTSYFTTGGIRGRKKQAGTYHPRSFNMGISREVFEKTGGYNLPRKGEDIDFSIRIIKQGFTVGLIEQAFVYHKRRTSIGQFYEQLQFFGRARINVNRIHPGELKLAHLFPLVFLIGIFLIPLILLIKVEYGVALGAFYDLYFILIFLDSTFRNRNPVVGALSMITAFVQLTAYAIGMVREFMEI